MTKFIDLTGSRFGMLTVVGEDFGSKMRHKVWRCMCDCGAISNVRGNSLKTGNTKSCGCLATKVLQERNTKHNMSKTKLYEVWGNMKSRCDNPSNDFYYCYGGRGITYDVSWSEFENFMSDMSDMCGGYEDGLSIERVDVNLGYSKSNCIWIPKSDQAKNRRKPRNNTSGFIGVSEYYNSAGTLYYRVRWVEDGENKVKYFSTKKYEDAYNTACDFRADVQKKLGYADTHGS